MTYYLLHLLAALTSEAAFRDFEAQGRIAPGTFGWWKVWGARPHDLRPGDLLLTKDGDRLHADLVLNRFEAKAAPMRVGFRTPESDCLTIGALVPVVILRPGTHHTLA